MSQPKNKKELAFSDPPALISFKMMLTKHIFDYHLIPEENQTRGNEDMKFHRVLKKSCKNPRIDKKRKGFLGVIKKKACGFSIGLGF